MLECLIYLGANFLHLEICGCITDYQLERDVGLLFEMLKAISIEISEDLSVQFEHELISTQNLDAIAGQLVENVILNHE